MDDWLWQPVSTHGVPIGRIVDVILGSGSENVVGFEVHCQDGRDRFLPRAAASLGRSGVEIDTPLALLDTDQLEFYRRGRREDPAA